MKLGNKENMARGCPPVFVWMYLFYGVQKALEGVAGRKPEEAVSRQIIQWGAFSGKKLSIFLKTISLRLAA